MASVSATSSAIIHVLDRNDNAPYFTQQLYKGEISESAPIASLILAVNETLKMEQRYVLTERLSKQKSKWITMTATTTTKKIAHQNLEPCEMVLLFCHTQSFLAQILGDPSHFKYDCYNN